jgi:hypothetical protein
LPASLSNRHFVGVRTRRAYESRAATLSYSIEERPEGENSSDLLRSLQLAEHELVSFDHVGREWPYAVFAAAHRQMSPALMTLVSSNS